MSREAFRAKRDELAALSYEAVAAECAPIDEEREMSLWRTWRAEFPKRAFDKDKAARKYPDVYYRFERRKRELAERHEDTRRRLTRELAALAPGVPLDPGDVDTLYSNHFPAEFPTASDPDTLARVRAYADEYVLASIGVTAGVRMALSADKDPHWNVWEVWVALDELQVEALNLIPHRRTDADIVRFCWSHGIDPRSYFYLPLGFERENGMDERGRPLDPTDGT